MKKSLICLFAVLALCACRTTMETPDGYTVRVEDRGAGQGDGTFCPPGQAKKGNC